MQPVLDIIIIIVGFIILLVASNRIGGFITKIKLPIITGLLLMGILIGPEFLNMLPSESIIKLNFVNHIALAFIAFAAGSELYLTELRSRIKSIQWMSFGQLVITFILGSLGVFIATRYPLFSYTLSLVERIAISILAGTIFVARSPVSAIAIINELRAKGPFTTMVLGVTVLKDFLVIILFAVTFSISGTLLTGQDFKGWMIMIILLELVVSAGIGFLLYYILKWILSLRLNTSIKSILVLAGGWSIYFVSEFLSHIAENYFEFDFYVEPLLVCIITGVLLTNYSPFRREFQKIITDIVPIVYVAFFTLVGATISLEVVIQTWELAIILFFIRIISLIVGGWVGGNLAGDPKEYNRIAWMPFVTQAGISLGLVTIIANEYPGWGPDFASVIIAVIVLNQFIGPPLMKWAIQLVKEDHSKGEHLAHKGPQKAIIFGYEHQAVALARQLSNHGLDVVITTSRLDIPKLDIKNVEIIHMDTISLTSLTELNLAETDAIITLKTDEENYKICELAYEHFGTPEIVVRLNNRENFKKFHDLGALIVEPSTAIVSLMDHFVRSPVATSLLLGLEGDQDTADIIIGNHDLHGMALRNLHLPADVLIIATRRRGHNIISTGYTRLRLGDILTIVGSVESIEKVRLRFE